MLKIVITGAYANIDWIQFCESETCEEVTEISSLGPVLRNDFSGPRLLKKGNALYIEKDGRRFDLTGHRLK